MHDQCTQDPRYFYYLDDEDTRLNALGIINEMDGFAYLAELSKNTPMVANTNAYADVVRDNAIKRFALAKIQDCTTALLDKSNLSTEDRLDAISKMMSQIAGYERSGKQAGLCKADEVASDWLEDWNVRKMQPERVAGLSVSCMKKESKSKKSEMSSRG